MKLGLRASGVVLALVLSTSGTNAQSADEYPSVKLPAPTESVPSYDAFGFAYVSWGRVEAIARRGIRHEGDSGYIATFGEPAAGLMTGLQLPGPAPSGSQQHDNRNLAGGIDANGCLVASYAQRNLDGSWGDLLTVSLNTDRATSDCFDIVAVPKGGDEVFSPYGPLVVLPSGRIMQTFYGWRYGRLSRVRAMFSQRGRVVWKDQAELDRSGPTEAAAALVDGATDQTSTLIAVARMQWRTGGKTVHALRQYSSSNGGRTWTKMGEIPASASAGAVMPWIATYDKDRVALIWADRGDLTIKMSIAPWKSVLRNPRAWPRPQVVYRSALRGLAHPNVFNFGYPSIVRTGSRPGDLSIVFYDAVVSGVGDAVRISDVALFRLPLTAPTEPVRLSEIMYK